VFVRCVVEKCRGWQNTLCYIITTAHLLEEETLLVHAKHWLQEPPPREHGVTESPRPPARTSAAR
jgi:hypothetical protein